MRIAVLGGLLVSFSLGSASAAPRNPLVGQPIGPLTGVRWVTPGGAPDAFANHKLTIIRWWTTNCAHCTASVPALAGLWKRYQKHGLNFVAMHHQKSRRARSDAQLRAYLKRLGFDGTLARDDAWTKLRELMRRAGFRRATSISVAVDAKGIVRWAHPGPRIHPSRNPRHAGADRDMRALEAFVKRTLTPPPPPGAPAPKPPVRPPPPPR